MMKNNKGFTLVELIISTAISSVVILSATILMTAGARTYSSIYYTSNLQYNSQIVTTQLKERVLDCNGGIVWDEKSDTLSVVNINSDGTKTMHCYKLTDSILTYGTVTSSNITHDDALVTFLQTSENIDDKMSENIAEFNVIPSDSSGKIDEIKLETTFENRGKSTTTQQNIALRNMPYYSDNIIDLLKDMQES